MTKRNVLARVGVRGDRYGGLSPSTAHLKGGSYPCPDCGGAAACIDSRPTLGTVRRRRVCTNAACGRRLTTFEVEVDSINPHAEVEAAKLLLLRIWGDVTKSLKTLGVDVPQSALQRAVEADEAGQVGVDVVGLHAKQHGDCDEAFAENVFRKAENG